MREIFLLILLSLIFKLQGISQDFDWVIPGAPNTPSGAVQIELTPANEPVGLLNTQQSMLLVKWDEMGNELFRIAPASDKHVTITDFKIDASENYYITGRYDDQMVIGSDTFASTGRAYFAAKINTSGEAEWFYQSNELFFNAVRIFPSQDVVFLTATIAKNVSIKNESNIQTFQMEYKNNQGFLKFSSSGNLLWAKFFGGDGHIHQNSHTWQFEVNEDALYYLNIILGEVDVDTGPDRKFIEGRYNLELIVIIKYNSSGEFLWYRKLADGSENVNRNLKYVKLQLDRYGNIFLNGNTWQEKTNIDFKGKETFLEPITNGSYYWIAKYDSSLSLYKGFALSSPNGQQYYRDGFPVAFTSYTDFKVKGEQIIISGRSSDNLILNSSRTVNSTSNKKHFFALYDLNLNYQTARFLGPDMGQPDYAIITDIDIDAHQNIYIVGSLRGQAKIFDFDPSSSESYLQDDSSDSFIARYFKCKKPIEIEKNYDESTCRRYVSSLTAWNDHYPVKWYNEAGTEVHEGMNYPLPKLTGPATFIAEDGCGYRDTVVIEKQELFTILQRIYPNPASEEIKVEMFNTSSRRIYLQLINTIGKVVYEKSVSSTEGMETLTIPIHNFSEGIYFLRIKDDCISEIRKILIVSP